jgi:hypothetical protein
MSAFKKLNPQDVSLTSYLAKKRWELTSAEFEENNIQILTGVENNLPFISGSVDYNESILYNSVQHLYYSNHFSSSVFSGSFENYYQSSFSNDTRNLEEEVFIISIPKNRTGIYLEPGSILFSFVENSYSGSIVDNKEGKLVLEDSNTGIVESLIGDVIYTHGIISITNNELVQILKEQTGTSSLHWNSNLPILTTTVTCKVSDFELNYTQNPSAITGSNGQFRDNITGSYFQPYITGIGIYNDSNELIAVGKFGQPIPKTPHTDMTFVIKLDM